MVPESCQGATPKGVTTSLKKRDMEETMCSWVAWKDEDNPAGAVTAAT